MGVDLSLKLLLKKSTSKTSPLKKIKIKSHPVFCVFCCYEKKCPKFQNIENWKKQKVLFRCDASLAWSFKVQLCYCCFYLCSIQKKKKSKSKRYTIKIEIINVSK